MALEGRAKRRRGWGKRAAGGRGKRWQTLVLRSLLLEEGVEGCPPAWSRETSPRAPPPDGPCNRAHKMSTRMRLLSTRFSFPNSEGFREGWEGSVSSVLSASCPAPFCPVPSRPCPVRLLSHVSVCVQYVCVLFYTSCQCPVCPVCPLLLFSQKVSRIILM